MQESVQKIINRKRVEKLQRLRSELPPRCNFGQILSDRLAKEGVVLSREEIYAMIRGTKTVHAKLVDHMQQLVNEVAEMV